MTVHEDACRDIYPCLPKAGALLWLGFITISFNEAKQLKGEKKREKFHNRQTILTLMSPRLTVLLQFIEATQ